MLYVVTISSQHKPSPHKNTNNLDIEVDAKQQQ